MQLEETLPYVSVIVALLAYLAGRQNGMRKDSEEKGKMLTELEYIKADVREIKDDVKDINVEAMRIELSGIKTDLLDTKKRVSVLEGKI